MENTAICPNCHTENIPLTDFYCPQCGAQLRIKPASTSTVTEILLYIGSLLLPPLGFWWAFKYFRIPDPRAKRIAVVCVVLTIISLIVSYFLFQGFMTNVNNQINSTSSLGF